jgi:hypothetical protein
MPEPKHHSYLLRFWQEGAEKKKGWRFVLVNLLEEQQWGFASMERLVDFLKEQVDALSSPDSVEQDDPDSEFSNVH